MRTKTNIFQINPRLGNLINIDDMYLFKPIEIKNENSSIYERSVPLEFKRASLSIELPDTINETILTKAVIDKDLNVDDEVSLILKKLQENWNNATTEQIVPRGNKSWYKFCSLVIKQFEGEKIEREILLNILRDHMMEELEFEDQLLLLNNYEENKNNKFLEMLMDYFKEQEISSKKVTGILLQSKGVLKLIVSNNDKGKKSWVLGQGEDYIDLEKEIINIKNELIPIKSKFNSIVGFMISFKKEYMIFKIKDLSGVRASKALRIDQSGKNITIKVLNDILNKEVYNSNTTINQKQLTIMIEFYLRLFQKNMKDNKYWFNTNPNIL